MKDTATAIEGIPMAVATIVEKWGAVIIHQRATPEDHEAKLIEFTDKLTRTMLKAYIEFLQGKLAQ